MLINHQKIESLEFYFYQIGEHFLKNNTPYYLTNAGEYGIQLFTGRQSQDPLQ